MPTIVLSYRREDSKWIAGRIFDRLEGHYGRGNVFMDIDTIPVGLDFREYLQQSLDRCDILPAVVGPRWLGTDEEGRHAIADETDWVRLEIETPLAKKIPVIPILIDRLRMPKASDLPETLRDFAFRQAAEVDSGVDFRSHMERLIRSMDQYLQRLSPAPSTGQLPDTKEEAKSPEMLTVAPTASSQDPVVPTPAAPQESAPTAPAMLPQAVAPALRASPNLALTAVFRTARSAVYSWIGIVSLLLASEVVAFSSEAIADATDRVLFIVLLAVPLGVVGLTSMCLRLLKWAKSHRRTIATRISMLLAGVLVAGAVPTFFHMVNPPERYIGAAAWPLVLLGGFGLTLIATAVISHPADARNRNTYAMACLGVAIPLLALAWLDSDLAAAKLWMTDWRARGVTIFTCIFVGGTVMLSAVVFWLKARRFAETS
jgi:TIR domain